MGKRKMMMISPEAQANRHSQYAMENFGIQIELLVDPVNEMTLLGYAEHNARDYFVAHLKMMAMNGSNHLRPTRLIFNNTFTTRQRHSIHRMQGYLLYKSLSVDGHLNIFIK